MSRIKCIIAVLALTGLAAFAQTDTNTPPGTNSSISFWQGLEDTIKSIGSEAPTNFVVAPYASYALDDKAHRFGGGLFGAWNLSQNIAIGGAFDYADGGFTMFTGQLTLKVPTHPLSFLGLTNFVATPFALGGVGTPISTGSSGGQVGSLASILGTGADISILKFGANKEWTLGLQGTYAQWSNTGGPHDGRHVYGGLTVSRGW